MVVSFPATLMTSPPNQVLYLYGMTRPSAAAPAVVGIDGRARVEALRCGTVVCWISRVDNASFGDRLEEKMQDLEWLAAAGIRHQRVLEELAKQATVLPAKFGTVFLTAQSLEHDVAPRRRSLAAAFRRLSDADEWGVKVFRLPAARARVTARSGREYLEQQSAASASATRTIGPEIRALATALTRTAVAVCPGGRIAGGQPGLIWHASFLVRRTHARSFHAALARFAKAWTAVRQIEHTGPWPPYSFVSNTLLKKSLASAGQARPSQDAPQNPKEFGASSGSQRSPDPPAGVFQQPAKGRRDAR